MMSKPLLINTTPLSPHGSTPREFQRLQADVGRLRKDHARAEGHKQGQEDQVKHLQRELQSELYATTEERYTSMVIDLKVRRRRTL